MTDDNPIDTNTYVGNNCKPGNTVRLEKLEVTNPLTVAEIAIIGTKVALECLSLNSAWSNVQTLPALPVHEGAEVKISCTTVTMFLVGSDTATCREGRLQPHHETPTCLINIGQKIKMRT
ncbi:hypothetical protein ACHWQZ_G012422 [Mnemiopsis leidyi]